MSFPGGFSRLNATLGLRWVHSRVFNFRRSFYLLRFFFVCARVIRDSLLMEKLFPKSKFIEKELL